MSDQQVDVDPTKETELPAEATLNPDGTVTLRLVVPVPWGKSNDAQPVAELTFGRPKGSQIRALDMSDARRNDSLLRLAGNITGRPPSFIDALDGKDAMNCVRVALYFFDASPPTGSKP